MEKLSKEDFERYSDMYFGCLDSMSSEELTEHFKEEINKMEATWQEIVYVAPKPIVLENESIPFGCYSLEYSGEVNEPISSNDEQEKYKDAA